MCRQLREKNQPYCKICMWWHIVSDWILTLNWNRWSGFRRAAAVSALIWLHCSSFLTGAKSKRVNSAGFDSSAPQQGGKWCRGGRSHFLGWPMNRLICESLSVPMWCLTDGMVADIMTAQSHYFQVMNKVDSGGTIQTKYPVEQRISAFWASSCPRETGHNLLLLIHVPLINSKYLLHFKLDVIIASVIRPG